MYNTRIYVLYVDRCACEMMQNFPVILPRKNEPLQEQIQQVADICCKGKMVSVLEGGYGEDMKNAAGAHGTPIVR